MYDYSWDLSQPSKHTSKNILSAGNFFSKHIYLHFESEKVFYLIFVLQ